MKQFNPVFLAALLLAASCSIAEEPAPDTVPVSRDVFRALIDDTSEDGTRVYADEHLKVLWHQDDRVSIFNKNTYNQQYRFDGNTGDNSGTFSIVPSGDFVAANGLDYAYSVYPYSSSTVISNDGIITVELPYEQEYAQKSFARGANAMIAATSDNVLIFKNLCGYLVFKLWGEGLHVSSLTLKANGYEPLAGTTEVSMAPGGVPAATVKSGRSAIIMNCPEPVALGRSESDCTEFWFVIPPVLLSKGFTLDVYLSDGHIVSKSYTGELTIPRNVRTHMAPLEIVPELFYGGHFVEKNPKYWFADIERQVYSTVRRNVLVPYSTDNDVRVFEKLLLDDWAYNTIYLTYENSWSRIQMGGMKMVWDDYWTSYHYEPFPSAEGYRFTYKFGSDNENISFQGRTWRVSDDGTVLSWLPEGSSYAEPQPVVKIDSEGGIITFIHDAVGAGEEGFGDPMYPSKYLLNLWSSHATDQDEMLYCSITMSAYKEDAHGDEQLVCEENMYARFLRPVDIVVSDNAILSSQNPQLPVASLFCAYDWNWTKGPIGYPLFTYHDIGNVSYTYYPDNYDTPYVCWYRYYGVNSIAVGIQGITTDLNGEGRRDLLSAVNHDAYFSVEDVRNPGVALSGAIDISEIENLANLVLLYNSNSADDHTYHYYVPMTLYYAWGALDFEVPITVVPEN